MPEVTLASWAAVRLDVFPKVIVWELENAGEESQEATVDRASQVISKRLDLIHEGMKTGRDAVNVLPVGSVPVELFNAIRRSTVTLFDRNSQPASSIEESNGSTAGEKVHLEAKWMFIARPDTRVRVEK